LETRPSPFEPLERAIRLYGLDVNQARIDGRLREPASAALASLLGVHHHK
jgi:hypothetical protein